MAAFIFGGDLLVMLFMIGLVLWVSLMDTTDRIEQAARIPLEDEEPHA